MRLDLMNHRNQAIKGRLHLAVEVMEIEAPERVRLAPHETACLEVRVQVLARPDNTYPLMLTFDAGAAGLAVHHEQLHVNLISRRTVTVDGSLDDWRDALPQTVSGWGRPPFAFLVDWTAHWANELEFATQTP